MPRLASSAISSFRRDRPAAGPVLSGAPDNHGVEALANLSLRGYLIFLTASFVLSYLGIEFSHASRFYGALWATDAVIVAALLRYAPKIRNQGAVLLGGAAAMLLAGLIQDARLLYSLIFTIADTAEAMVAIMLLMMFGINASNLATFRNLLMFIVLAGGVAPLASVAICATVLGPAYAVPWGDLWRNWYSGHALAMIIVTPFLLSVGSRRWQARLGERWPEAAAVVLMFIVIGLGLGSFRSLLLAFPPAILIATVRFGLFGATTATLVTTVFASIVIIGGIGQPLLPLGELPARVLSLQIFLALTAFWALPTAALLGERDGLLSELSQANAKLTAESEQKSRLVVGLRHALAVTEERERLRLSRELHDQAGQDVIAAVLEINAIDSALEEPARGRLNLVRKKMEALGRTLHRIAWELRPAAINELGLHKALTSYLSDWSERCGTEVDFHCDDPQIDEVPNEVGTAVFRVVQEGLTNIVKHAQRPNSVSVIVRRSDKTLQVIIEDNGCGFDAAAKSVKAASNGGLGLDGMRERLALIGGTLEIESEPGGGTTIFARIALDNEGSAA